MIGKRLIVIFIRLFITVALMIGVASTERAYDLSTKSVGFLGCGKISSAVAKGYAGALPSSRPQRIIVSPRSESKSRALREDHPDIIEIASSNEELVNSVDVVFIGLLPGPARDILPHLPFRKDQILISMMAAVDFGELVRLTYKVDASNIVRTVPLPSNSLRTGPILLHPPNADVETILSVVGTPVVCKTEAEMKPLVSLTGHISSFFELMRVTQHWAEQEGVESDTARAYVSSFYASLASSTVSSPASFEELREEAATPGGLNEQSLRSLMQGEHFHLAEQSLQEILDRLQGKARSKEDTR